MLWSVLAAIYHLGCAGVTRSNLGRAVFAKQQSAQRAAHCLGVSLDDLSRAVFQVTGYLLSTISTPRVPGPGQLGHPQQERQQEEGRGGRDGRGGESAGAGGGPLLGGEQLQITGYLHIYLSPPRCSTCWWLSSTAPSPRPPTPPPPSWWWTRPASRTRQPAAAPRVSCNSELVYLIDCKIILFRRHIRGAVSQLRAGAAAADVPRPDDHGAEGEVRG